MASALADATKSAKPEAPKQPQKKAKTGDALLDALADMEAMATANEQASTASGQGIAQGRGQGAGQGGIEGVYVAQVMSLVRQYWEFPQLATRQNLQARVRVMIDRTGTIVDASLVTSSGRPDFDASTLKALATTAILPPPPSKEYQTLLLVFNLQEMVAP